MVYLSSAFESHQRRTFSNTLESLIDEVFPVSKHPT